MSTKATKVKRWPTLKFERFGRLDWEVIDYEPGTLAALGKELQRSPQRPLDWAIGQVLNDLSASPAALKALNRLPQRAPQETRSLNVAVHYLAWLRLKDKAAAAQWNVAKTWGMRRASVQSAYRKWGDKAAIELDALVEMCIARKQGHAKTDDVLRDVDLDMRARAAFSGFRIGAAKVR